MIRLIVLYNLPPDADEEAFLNWRLTEHQAANASMPGVVHTDFSRIYDAWTAENPDVQSPYRFMTIADWPDRASFEAVFYDPEFQVRLKESLKKIADPIFLISEVLISF
jgi:hypothetical protein